MDGPAFELPTRTGHVFSNTIVSGNSKVHQGDVYNYYDSESEERSNLDWLTSLDPSQSHHQALTQFKEGTLKWFFEDDHFLKWCHDRDDSDLWLLWCRGDMGTGKTTLSARITEHLKTADVQRGHRAVVYCRHAERYIQTVENFLGSILTQLYQRDDHGFKIPSDVSVARKRRLLFWKNNPSFQELQQWLHQRIQATRTVFVILDAIDELQDTSRRKLLSVLQSMPHGCLRLLVTSRNAPETPICSFEYQAIEIFTHEEDLRIMLNTKLQEEGTERFQHLVSSANARNALFASTEEEIKSKIAGAAKNMYVCLSTNRWYLFFSRANVLRFIHASLNLERILECTRLEDIYHYLDHMPLDMDAYYDQTWERATSSVGPIMSARTKLILMWVTFAKQPLTMKALAQAVAASDPGTNGELLTKQEIISSCAGFVRAESLSPRRLQHNEIEGPGGSTDLASDDESVAAIVHLTAHNYLEAKRQSYFPHKSEAMLVACLSSSTPDQMVHALPLHYTLLAEHDLSIHPGTHKVLFELTPDSLPFLLVLLGLSIADFPELSQQRALAAKAASLLICIICPALGFWLGSLALFETKQTTALTLTRYVHANMRQHMTGASLALNSRPLRKIAKSHILYVRMILFWSLAVAVALMFFNSPTYKTRTVSAFIVWGSWAICACLLDSYYIWICEAYQRQGISVRNRMYWFFCADCAIVSMAVPYYKDWKSITNLGRFMGCAVAPLVLRMFCEAFLKPQHVSSRT